MVPCTGRLDLTACFRGRILSLLHLGSLPAPRQNSFPPTRGPCLPYHSRSQMRRRWTQALGVPARGRAEREPLFESIVHAVFFVQGFLRRSGLDAQRLRGTFWRRPCHCDWSLPADGKQHRLGSDSRMNATDASTIRRVGRRHKNVIDKWTWRHCRPYVAFRRGDAFARNADASLTPAPCCLPVARVWSRLSASSVREDLPSTETDVPS